MSRERPWNAWCGALALLLGLAWHGGLHAWQVLLGSSAIALLWALAPKPWIPSWSILLGFAAILGWQLLASIQAQISLDQALWLSCVVALALQLRAQGRPKRSSLGLDLFIALAVLACGALFLCERWLPLAHPERVWWGTHLVADATHLFFPNQNLLAATIVVPALFFGAARLWQGASPLGLGAALLFLTAGLTNMGSRGSLLVLGAGGLWWALRAWQNAGPSRRLVWALGLWILALGVIWKAPGSGLQLRADANAKAATEDPFRNQRLKFWRASLNASLLRPLGGWGQGAFAEAIQGQDTGSELSEPNPIAKHHLRLEHAHDEILEMTVEWGWPVTLSVIVLVLAWVLRRWRRREAEASTWALEAALIGILVHALVDMPLRPPFSQVGLAMAWAWLEAPSEGAVPDRSASQGRRWAMAGVLIVTLLLSLGACLSVQLRALGDGIGRARIRARTALLLQPLDAKLAALELQAGLPVPRAAMDLWGRDSIEWLTASQALSPQRWVELRPYDAFAWLALSQARAQASDIKGAQEALDRALELEPNFRRAWQWQARLAQRQGSKDLALKAGQALQRIQHLQVPEDQRDDAIVRMILAPDPAL